MRTVNAALLGVPLYTLAAYEGMGDAPGSLRKVGIVSILGKSADRGDVELPLLKKDIVEGHAKNFSHFIDCTTKVYQATKALDAEFIVLIGGECSMTPGSLAGLGESFRGKPGMLWLDAHGDFNTPETSPSGYIGGMCLAMACGRGPRLGDEVEKRRPLLAEDSLVHVGSRALDPAEAREFNSSPAELFAAQQVRKSGAPEVAAKAAKYLSDRSDWVVCHLDVDVVDPRWIPAVNYPTPGGLTTEETKRIVQALLKTGKMNVLELSAYNASADRNRKSARAIVDLVGEILS